MIIWAWKWLHFPLLWCHIIVGAPLWHHCDLDTIVSALQHSRHPQEGAVKVWKQSDWWFWDIDVFVNLMFFWSLSDHPGSETWPQNQPHSSSSPNLPRPHPVPLLVHWQLEQHPSAYPSMTGTQKMPITLSPFSNAPLRTGSFSTTFQLIVRTTSDMSLQHWEPNP